MGLTCCQVEGFLFGELQGRSNSVSRVRISFLGAPEWVSLGLKCKDLILRSSRVGLTQFQAKDFFLYHF